MKTLNLNRFGLIFLILLSTVGLDQISKFYARKFVTSEGPIDYFNSVLSLKLAENSGAFLSFGGQLPDFLRFFVFSFLVSLFLIYFSFYVFKNKKDWMFTLAASLILGGGIGNLIDRLTKGTVTDFLILKAGPLSTGIFNIADMAIVVGVLLFFWAEHLEGQHKA
jgi:signal peptidase II